MRRTYINKLVNTDNRTKALSDNFNPVLYVNGWDGSDALGFGHS